MSLRLKRSAVTFALVSLLAIGCGSRDEIVVETEKNSADAIGLTDVACIKGGACPQLPIYIDGPNGATQIVANLEQDNSMRFGAKAERGTTSNLKMRMYFGPEQCKNKWAGQDTAEVSCTWRPVDATETGKIKAIARDVSYCLEKYAQNPSCSDMAKSIPDVDKEQEFEFTVADDVQQQIDPAFTDSAGPQLGANGGVKGCGMGMLSGLLGVLQGNFMSAIMGCVGGYIGGLQQSSPTVSTNTGTVGVGTAAVPGTTTNSGISGF